MRQTERQTGRKWGSRTDRQLLDSIVNSVLKLSHVQLLLATDLIRVASITYPHTDEFPINSRTFEANVQFIKVKERARKWEKEREVRWQHAPALRLNKLNANYKFVPKIKLNYATVNDSAQQQETGLSTIKNTTNCAEPREQRPANGRLL